MLEIKTESNYLAKVIQLGKPQKHPNADKLQLWDVEGYQIEFTNKNCTIPLMRIENGDKYPSFYRIGVTKVDVGCKCDTLVSQWQEVYAYYNSIKD